MSPLLNSSTCLVTCLGWSRSHYVELLIVVSYWLYSPNPPIHWFDPIMFSFCALSLLPKPSCIELDLLLWMSLRCHFETYFLPHESSLVIKYPHKFFPRVFRSRMIFYLTLDFYPLSIWLLPSIDLTLCLLPLKVGSYKTNSKPD